MIRYQIIHFPKKSYLRSYAKNIIEIKNIPAGLPNINNNNKSTGQNRI